MFILTIEVLGMGRMIDYIYKYTGSFPELSSKTHVLGKFSSQFPYLLCTQHIPLLILFTIYETLTTPNIYTYIYFLLNLFIWLVEVIYSLPV